MAGVPKSHSDYAESIKTRIQVRAGIEQKIKEINQLKSQGLTVDEIAEKLHMTSKGVESYIKDGKYVEFGVAETIAHFKEYPGLDLSSKEIGYLVGLSEVWVERIYKWYKQGIENKAEPNRFLLVTQYTNPKHVYLKKYTDCKNFSLLCDAINEYAMYIKKYSRRKDFCIQIAEYICPYVNLIDLVDNSGNTHKNVKIIAKYPKDKKIDLLSFYDNEYVKKVVDRVPNGGNEHAS